MVIELPEQLEVALKMKADERGVSAAGYVREILERDLSVTSSASPNAFKNSRGMLAKYGSAPSAEEIDANRAEMFRNLGEQF